MRIPGTILVVAALTSPLAAASEPEVVLRPLGLTLRHVPPVLTEETIARHLDTGLTTGFVFTVDAGRYAGRSLKGEAQVRIRYDLWDERYVLERWDARRDSPLASVLAKPDLPEWWRVLELVVLPGASGPSAQPAQARVTLRVLPFSQAEQRDAQDWLLRSFQTPPENHAPAQANPRPAAEEAAPLRNLYGSMLAASIGQRSLITYSWTVAVTMESR
jgi:hypothetical protein